MIPICFHGLEGRKNNNIKTKMLATGRRNLIKITITATDVVSVHCTVVGIKKQNVVANVNVSIYSNNISKHKKIVGIP